MATPMDAFRPHPTVAAPMLPAPPAEVSPREAFLKSGALQSAIFDSTHFSSIATDEQGVIQIFNVGAESLLGYEASEVVNKMSPAELSGTAADDPTIAPIKFRGNGETILVVDDEPAVRRMSCMVLENLNFLPLTANDGVDALVKVAEHRSTLAGIISDFHMPHMDGLAFVQALRRILPDLPVVIASGLMDEITAAKFQALGVTLRLDKPYSETQLAEVMQKLLVRKVDNIIE